jgi:AraC-like DNA-binding protein
MKGWNGRPTGEAMSNNSSAGHCDFRRTIFANTVASVENVSISKAAPLPAGHEREYQVVLPYAGLFTYRIGRRHWQMDSSKTLLISPGWDYQDEHPLEHIGHACVLINPSRELIDDICGAGGASRNQAFLSGSVRSTRRLRVLTGLALSNQGSDDILRNEEWSIRALKEAIQGQQSLPQGSSRIVDRAKQALHELGFDRISLTDIAKHVGASPVYLTQEFTRCEGMPLYQYQLALRLDRALLELPHCNDITSLALALGFSSHSHFSAAFHRWYGLTPSAYRNRPGKLARNANSIGVRAQRRAPYPCARSNAGEVRELI